MSTSNWQALNNSKPANLLFEVFDVLLYLYQPTLIPAAMHTIIIVSFELIFCTFIVIINRTFISINNSVPKQTMIFVSSILFAHHVSLYATSHIRRKIFTITKLSQRWNLLVPFLPLKLLELKWSRTCVHLVAFSKT